MKYELAKKLKDAGFRQDTKFGIWEGATDYLLLEECPKTWGNTIACPTLSELIEACGTKVFHLRIVGRNGVMLENIYWEAKGEKELIGEGKSPEEAVANLWLKLNNHD